jgi:hypothetical protein
MMLFDAACGAGLAFLVTAVLGIAMAALWAAEDRWRH